MAGLCGASSPTCQLSIGYAKPPGYHIELARQLRDVRNHGVLALGSGNMVHNLRALSFGDRPYDRAEEFDQRVARMISEGDDAGVVNFLPLNYALGLRSERDVIEHFN